MLTGAGDGSVLGLEGKTTTDMKTVATFTDAGWDFIDDPNDAADDIWAICEGTNYPRLVWQIPTGDFLCPDGVNFTDFSYFADRWFLDDCNEANNYCQGADIDTLGSVDLNDMIIFCEEWLKGVE